MNYLNGDITITVSLGSPSPVSKKMYAYTISSKFHDDVIFRGNLYYSGGSSVTIDITDLVRNQALVLYKSGGSNYGSNLIDTYTAGVVLSSTRTQTGKTTVCHVYSYRHLDSASNMSAAACFFEPQASSRVSPCLQGAKYNSSSMVLMPEYPLYQNGQDMDYSPIRILTAVEFDSNVSQLTYRIAQPGGSTVTNYTVFPDGYNVHVRSLPIGGLSQYDDNQQNEIYLEVKNQSAADSTYKKIAKFNPCYAHYYLQWQDRYGAMQSQPFYDRLDYSEDFTRHNIIDKSGKKVITGVEVQPKVSLWSGWLTPEIYKYYESIFTSPYLFLVDTEVDTYYDVIVTGNYTEKNYKNTKGLLNLQLNLEYAKTQNIIY